MRERFTLQPRASILVSQPEVMGAGVKACVPAGIISLAPPFSLAPYLHTSWPPRLPFGSFPWFFLWVFFSSVSKHSLPWKVMSELNVWWCKSAYKPRWVHIPYKSIVYISVSCASRNSERGCLCFCVASEITIMF